VGIRSCNLISLLISHFVICVEGGSADGVGLIFFFFDVRWLSTFGISIFQKQVYIFQKSDGHYELDDCSIVHY
jgi:hypothetical protein